MREAIAVANRLSLGSIVADISFDSERGKSFYRVHAAAGGKLEELNIDAATGEPSGDHSGRSIGGMTAEDRENLALLQPVQPTMSDAVRIAEHATSGQAVSGGVAKKEGKLNFVAVVLSGDELKQLILELSLKVRPARKY